MKMKTKLRTVMFWLRFQLPVGKYFGVSWMLTAIIVTVWSLWQNCKDAALKKICKWLIMKDRTEENKGNSVAKNVGKEISKVLKRLMIVKMNKIITYYFFMQIICKIRSLELFIAWEMFEENVVNKQLYNFPSRLKGRWDLRKMTGFIKVKLIKLKKQKNSCT